MNRKDKYSQHSSIIWPVWLNGWVFVYELSGCGFESSCSHLVSWHVIPSKCYAQGAMPKELFQYFFDKAPKISWIKEYIIPRIWVSRVKFKVRGYNQNTLNFENAMYRVHSERKNVAVSTTNHQQFSEKKNSFTDGILISSDKLKPTN